MSTADDSSKKHPAVHAAIRVKIGEIGVTAILDEKNSFNAIHRKVFKKICEQDNDNKTYEDVGGIELDLTIDDRPVSVVFSVLKDLYTDMVLGEDFFHSIKAHVHLGLGLLKWSYKDELVITNMVEKDDDFRALSGGANFDLYAEMGKAPRKSLKSDGDSSKNKKRRKVETGKFGETNNEPSNSSGDGASAAENSEKDFVKIFIHWFDMWDLRTGECLSYYGVSCPEKKILFFAKELLESNEIKVWDRKTNTPMSHFMKIMSLTFDKAKKHGLKNVHILSDKGDGIHVMTTVQKTYEDFGDMEWDELNEIPYGLHGPIGFSQYYAAGSTIPEFESVKFEFVPPNDQTYQEMVRLRNLVETYSERNPL